MQIFRCYLEILEAHSPTAKLSYDTILKALERSPSTDDCEQFLLNLLSMMARDKENRPFVEDIIEKYSS